MVSGREGRERRLGPEELTGHARLLWSFRPQQLEGREVGALLYGEICPGLSHSLHSHSNPAGACGRIKNVLGAEEGVKVVGRKTGRPLLAPDARSRVAGPTPLARVAGAVVLETFAAPRCVRLAQAYVCAPTAADTRALLPSPSPNKRQKLWGRALTAAGAPSGAGDPGVTSGPAP